MQDNCYTYNLHTCMLYTIVTVWCSDAHQALTTQTLTLLPLPLLPVPVPVQLKGPQALALAPYLAIFGRFLVRSTLVTKTFFVWTWNWYPFCPFGKYIEKSCAVLSLRFVIIEACEAFWKKKCCLAVLRSSDWIIESEKWMRSITLIGRKWGPQALAPYLT